MKSKLILVIVLLTFFLGFVYSRVFASIPDPIIEYQLASELQGVYLPKSGTICWVTSMGNANYYIGPYIPDSNTHLLVVRFLSKQTPVGMGRYVKCEAPTNVSAEQRAEWVMARDSSINRSKVKIYYVDGSWDQVTLTVTPSHSTTSTPSPTFTGTLTPSATSTPKAAPWPTMVFYTGDSVDTIQYYAPKKNELCLTWNPYTGFIGPFSIPAGNNFLIVKFTEDQTFQAMRIVWCEDATNHTPEERLSFTIQTQPCCYFWNRSVIRYVGKDMLEVTLTSTPTISNTPSVTSTPTASVTMTPTITSTRTSTSTRTPTRTSSPSRTLTSTVVPAIEPDLVVPSNVSTLYVPKSGDICFGILVEGNRNSVVEYVTNYRSGIEISGGGCFTKRYFSLSQILRYLGSRGLNYSYLSLPRPTLTPSRTLQPTITIVPYLAIGVQTTGSRDILVSPGLICWGYKVGNYEYKAVRFSKNQSGKVRITNGGCTLGQGYSAEDVYNFFRRTSKVPLNGFIELK